MEIFFKNLTPEEGTAEKLLDDLRILKQDTEELFRAAGGKLAEKSKQKFLSAVEKTRQACEEVCDQSSADLQAEAGAGREYPFSAVGVAFGLGVLLGAMALRRRVSTS